jgi:hypothetical protein
VYAAAGIILVAVYLLAPMLKGSETTKREGHRVGMTVHAEQSTLILKFVGHSGGTFEG